MKQIRASSLGDFLVAPKVYHWNQVLKRREPSPAMNEGTLLHQLVLEPEKFKKQNILLSDPEINYLKTVSDLKEWLDSWDEPYAKSLKKDDLEKLATDVIEDRQIKNVYTSILIEKHGLNVLTETMDLKLSEMAKAITDHPFMKTYPVEKYAEVEVELTMQHNEMFSLGGRCDWIIDRGEKYPIIVVDIKKSRTAHPRGFERAIGQYGYHLQAAIYHDLVKEKYDGRDVVFCWIVVEPNAPYICEVFAADHACIEAGQDGYKAIIKQIEECYEKDHWPGYTDGLVNNISLTSWDFDKVSELVLATQENGEENA